MQRRLVLSLALAAAALPARAQDTAPALRLVVPFATGTTTDNVARIVGTAMAATLRQQVLVDNRPGAGGTTATEQVARAQPDGQTLVMGTVGTHAINATLFRTLRYDPRQQFVPVAFAGYTPLLLVVPAQSPAKSPADLATLARRAEGATFASAGNGTSGHLAGELMNELGGRMIHVPYKDGSQALTDLMAGNVDFMFYHPSAVMPHVRSGKLRVLGITSASRSAQAPEVPTLAEQGLPGVDLVAWFMVYAPAGVPAATLERLRSAGDAALAQPEVRTRLAAQGVELRPLQGEALARFTGSEITKWAALVKRSGAQVD
ncbi:tripartite tricarboxylate transporter substrate binding protein [Aquincola tertiaricarbonis]|uniref:Tripartite tricarboxylate transporter substrate binding protein n=1 Tax=Aquincola tertiaricarbonis TaxID=391953 RepID=A0ABY4S2A4_AQUTE|nr:tripartite tricarboxylate transporter substrate binding protein [Aquincola tertiaricarbonis]URI07114.1 tripartite tricarboxylate transporter substrate binding protein [Aquincola tertiaricarbonis]